ncbi:MAG TPA: biopolymer transporter ExbD, partial [Polyangia bacterium]|nr:biopolymer transporter ExbD [Polyangia bacterium]
MNAAAPGGAAPPRPVRRRRRLASKRHPKGLVRADINVTPLVDVVLVLLIIFLVVTPMIARGVS